MGCQVIDKNQPIRLAGFGAHTQKFGGVPAQTTYSKDPDVARDRSTIKRQRILLAYSPLKTDYLNIRNG